MPETQVLINGGSLWLRCLIEGESMAFTVETSCRIEIGNLKEEIQRQRALGTLKDVDPHTLRLWKVDIDLKNYDHRPLSHLKLENPEVEELTSWKSVEDYWSHQPPTTHLHIIVKAPATATTSLSTSHTSQLSRSSPECASQKKWFVNGAIHKHDIAGCYYLDPGLQRESRQCLKAVSSQQYVLLLGAGGSGKTTRLLCLRDKLELMGYDALYIPFEGLAFSASPDAFWRSFGTLIQVAAQGREWGRISISSQSEFLKFFAADGKRIVLLFDDFSKLQAATPLIRNECHRAFRLIRNDSQHYNVQTIIAAGTFGTLPLILVAISPFNLSNHVLNPYFNIEQTKELFRQFTQDTGILIEDAVVEDVWAKSSGHPGMVCICGRAIVKYMVMLCGHTSGPVTYDNWQQFPISTLYGEIQESKVFSSLLESLLRPGAHDAMLLLRSHFAGSLGEVEVPMEEERLANYLTGEGVLLQPDVLHLSYRMASPLLDGIIRTDIIPQMFPGAPPGTPPHILGTLDVLGTLTESLKYIDRELVYKAACRSHKMSRNVFDTELLRILANWLRRGHDWTVTSRWHLQTSLKHTYADIVLKKDKYPVIVLELMATADPSSVKSHIEKTSRDMNFLSADEPWVVVHFTPKDNYCPVWQSDEDLVRGVNVVHFAHDLKFTKVVINARWRDNGGHTHQVHDVLELV